MTIQRADNQRNDDILIKGLGKESIIAKLR